MPFFFCGWKAKLAFGSFHVSHAVTRGSGSKNEDKERNIRKWFVERDLIDGVILLPDNLFYNTTAAGVIIVLRSKKPKDRRGKIVLVNASREFTKGNPKNYLSEDALRKIAASFLKAEPVESFLNVITNEEAAKNDFNLSPSRYLTNGNEAGTHREIAAIVKDLETFEGKAADVTRELQKVLAQLK